MTAILEIKDLWKKYSEGFVLKGINLKIESGQIIGIIGSNGAGKSTLIQCILGLNNPTKGEILIKDMSIQEDELAVKKALAYIPELPLLYNDLTVWEHLRLVAMAFEMKEQEFKEKAEALLRRFELLDKRNRIPSDFSKGMRQKVAISCALLHDADILLVDEPFTGLDVASTRDLRHMLKELNKKGKTIIIATHNLDAAEKMCESFLIMKEGQTLSQGTLESIKVRSGLKEDSSLEDIYFSLLEGSGYSHE